MNAGTPTSVTFEKAITMLHKSGNNPSTINLIKRVNPKAYRMFMLLGYDTIKALEFKRDVLDRKYNIISNLILHKDFIISELEKRYELNKWYLSSEINDLIIKLFKELGIKTGAKTTAINVFFNAKHAPTRMNGKSVRGIMLLSKRETLEFSRVIYARK